MEGEIGNFIKIWTWVIASLCYCRFTGKVVPKGRQRLLAILPVVVLFLLLPLSLSSVNLGGMTSFFIAWLANFKLLLFAFDLGPLAAQPSISLRSFIVVACLPIQIRASTPTAASDPQTTTADKNRKKASVPAPVSVARWLTMGLLIGLLLQAYEYSHRMHPNLLLLLYCVHMYLCLEIYLGIVAALVRSFLKLELEPQFNRPYISTSLQDFWGHRWNLVVTNILRPLVYDPVRRAASRLVGRSWAMGLGVLAAFGVSALMHELMYYYLGRTRPTWEVTCFFLLHGVCVAAEGMVKKWWCARTAWRLPRLVSTALTVGFLVVTGFWLFFPQLMRFKVYERGFEEYGAVRAFFMDVGRRAPLLNATTAVW